MEWLATMPVLRRPKRDDIWLLLVYAENERYGRQVKRLELAPKWEFSAVTRPDPVFDGNQLLNDALVFEPKVNILVELSETELNYVD